jgi:transmembrane sensor
MSYTDDINLVHKHLTGELGSEEIEHFKNWKESNPQHKILADQLETIWDTAAKTSEISFDADKAYEKHLARMKSDLEETVPSVQNSELQIKNNNHSNKTKIFNLTWVRSIAALFILAIAVVFIFENKNEDKLINSDQVLTLSDGSRVWLQKGSSLNTSSFSPNNRNLKLKGVGYFDVKSNSEAPFKIDANGFDIQVLGTKFIVNATTKEVRVKEGKVKVSNKKDNVILVANQKALINKSDELKVENANFDNTQLWFNEELKFNNVPFDQVIKDISESYNVKFTLPARNDWSNCAFTSSGSLKDNTLDQVLLILKLTYELEYTRTKDNNIILTKVKCK